MNTQNTNLKQFQNLLSFYSNNTNLAQIIGNALYDSYTLRCKNGSKIHIKKKNKGKFTQYCGGTVTQECIQRGKNSSNPVIRKRATFADNARKWNS